MLLGPVLIEPLFNKFEPVPTGAVRNALQSMAADAGIAADRIFLFDGSRQSNNFTANVSGIGSSARVAISDVALKAASLDEVKAVTGHEIGHYVLHHVWQGMALSVLLITLGFLLIDRLYPIAARTLGSDAGMTDARGLPVLLLMLTLLGLVGTPINNTVTRRSEAEADRYSLRTVNLPDALAGALVKTAEYRYPRPGALEEWLFYSHPSVERRVRTAMEWKATHPTTSAGATP
jgi:STE24 endopeptidase